MDLARTLDYLRPGEAFQTSGDSYSGLEWLANTEKPTEAECLAAWQELSARDQARTQARAAMAAAFDALPTAVKGAFYSARVSAEDAMDKGKFDIAKAIVEAVAVPPELEATKQSILDLFPA